MELRNKRDEFKNRLKHDNNDKKTIKNNDKKIVMTGAAIVLAAEAAVVVGNSIARNINRPFKPIDMSKYNIDNTKYEDYIKESGDKESETSDKLYRMAMLEENIRIYKELKGKKLTDSQKESLDIATRGIKSEMSSSMISKIYLNDIFKEKILEAYDANYVKVNYRVPKGEEIINVELYNSIDGVAIPLKKEDMIDEVKSAVKDIVSLQDLENKDKPYNDKDINEFIRAYDNMKGFSNLTLVKNGNQPLTIQENVLVDLPNGNFTVYSVNIDDEKNVNITGKKDIEVKDNKIISEEEER